MGEKTDTYREAVRILMQSPFYFRMDLRARKRLVNEFRSHMRGKPVAQGSGRYRKDLAN